VISPHKLAGTIRSLSDGATTAPWLFVFGLSAILLILPFAVRLDGQTHADWIQFLGRFHPLLVHLPIGTLLLLPFLELGGTTRLALRETAGFILQFTLAAAAMTLVFGLLLAYGSGVMGTTVTRHMWGGIALMIELLVCVAVRPAWTSGQIERVYPALLTVTLLTLAWTAHQGGSLTYGSDYLTRYMPVPLQRLFRLQPAASDAAYSGSVYLRSIHPILDAKCVACHGATKEQAGLRLDFYEWLMKGGKDGAIIAPLNPDKSLLLQRVTLSPTDRHFMPAEKRTPLTAEEIATLHSWILNGASPTATNVPGIAVADVPLQPVGDYSYLLNEIHQMQQSQGAKLVAVSAKPSDGLILRTVDVSSKFDDAELARFQKFAPFIVEAELARTSVTDAGFDTLSKFTNLRALHLEVTAVTGRNLAKLSGLSQLSYLNLSGTKVTTEALTPLKGMPNLRHVYLFDTPAEPTSEATKNTIRSTQ
jgi:uncharacterized membrane protein